MKNKTFLFFAAVMFLFTVDSCQHHYPVSLVEADSLVYSNPKAALQKLDSLSLCLDTTQRADVMYLRLLKMTAKDKLYMSFGTLDSVQSLVGYYEDNGDKQLLPRAYYMLGRMFVESEDVPSALAAYRKVLAQLEQHEDIRLRGITNAQLGEMFGRQEILSLALSFYKEAFLCDSLLADEVGMLYDMRDMGTSFDYLGMKDSANVCFRKALTKAREVKDDDMEHELLLHLANSYLDVNADSVAKYMFLVNDFELLDRCEEGCIKGAYLQMIGRDKAADSVFTDILPQTTGALKLEILRRLVGLSCELESYEKAKKYVKAYLRLSDSLKIVGAKEQEAKGLALYDYTHQMERGNVLEIQNKNKQIALLIAAICLILLLLVLFAYWELSIVKKLRLQNRIKEWRLGALLKTKKEQNAEIYEQVGLASYVEAGNHLSQEGWLSLEESVENHYPGFKEKLYSCSKLSEHEFRVCLLIKAKVPTSKIALLTSRASSTISTTKQRLYKKLTSEQGSVEDLDKLLAIL